MLLSESGFCENCGIHFQHHVVLVQLSEYGGNLALSEGVVKGVVNGLGQNAQARRSVAIDHQFCFKSAILLVGGDVAHGQATSAVRPPVWAPTATTPSSRHPPSNIDTGCG